MSIMNRINAVQETIFNTSKRKKEVTIIGVTKYVDVQSAESLLANGISNLGENRPEAFLEKYEAIGNRATWHFIGSLQTRKVRDVINKIDFLHSLDRESLAAEIQKRATRNVKCFVQVNMSGEVAKHGVAPDDAVAFVRSLAIYDKIEVIGLMTMAANTSDKVEIKQTFERLALLRETIAALALDFAPCAELSMGMSNDFEIAVACGATYVRLGSVLLG